MQVTVKTLRHYEQKGLLLPHDVDNLTGYRYYSIDQMQKLKSIRELHLDSTTILLFIQLRLFAEKKFLSMNRQTKEGPFL